MKEKYDILNAQVPKYQINWKKRLEVMFYDVSGKKKKL